MKNRNICDLVEEFQFLIGSLETGEFTGFEMLHERVSIPYR